MNLEGWAWDSWGGVKMHYYRNQKSLCVRFEHPYGIYHEDFDQDLKCKICAKRKELEK